MVRVLVRISNRWRLEHEHGITIQLLDNPGWDITIDLVNYESLLEDIPYILLEKDAEWLGCKLNSSYLNIAGDIRKLSVILKMFKEIIETLDTLKEQNKSFTSNHLNDLMNSNFVR